MPCRRIRRRFDLFDLFDLARLVSSQAGCYSSVGLPGGGGGGC